MFRFFIFILILFLENLILPASIGSGQLLITTIFIACLLIYNNSWRILLYQVVPFILITEFFTGENFGHLLIPFVLTGIAYIMMNKFINLSQNLNSKDQFLSNSILGTLTLVMFNGVYAGLFIFFDTSYSLSTSWHEFTIFLKSSLLSLIGWSILISVLFHYVLKKK